jgi:hypothetical protein
MARWTRRVGIFTAALGAVAVITAVIFGKQLGVMQGQLDEMKTASADAKAAIEATNRLADEAKRQADLTKESLILSRRPWVDFADGPVIDEPLTFEGNGFVTLSVKSSGINSGNSPALNVMFENNLHLGEWPSGDINEIIKQYICQPKRMNFTGAPFTQLIMPNVTVALWPSKDKSNKIDDDKPQIVSAWTSICLRYEDEFGIPHATGQIFAYIPDSGEQMRIPAVGPVSGSLKPYTGKILK